MSRFGIQPAPLKGLSVLQRHPIRDDRGSLDRLFCLDELKPLLGQRTIVQVNHTVTVKTGTIRGMHFQHPPHAEMKLVTCLHGGIFDVAVDLRAASPTFLHWHGEHLSADNHRTLAIPEGFAHGFQSLTDDCELLYLHTAAYQLDAEDGLDALDPVLGIRWPVPVSERSARDQAHAPITAAFTGLNPAERDA